MSIDVRTLSLLVRRRLCSATSTPPLLCMYFPCGRVNTHTLFTGPSGQRGTLTGMSTAAAADAKYTDAGTMFNMVSKSAMFCKIKVNSNASRACRDVHALDASRASMMEVRSVAAGDVMVSCQRLSRAARPVRGVRRGPPRAFRGPSRGVADLPNALSHERRRALSNDYRRQNRHVSSSAGRVGLVDGVS